MDGPGDFYDYDEKYSVFTFYDFCRVFPGLCCYNYEGYWNYGVFLLPGRDLNYMLNVGYLNNVAHWNNDNGFSRDVVHCLP
jgi:hypothetical protein